MRRPPTLKGLAKEEESCRTERKAEGRVSGPECSPGGMESGGRERVSAVKGSNEIKMSCEKWRGEGGRAVKGAEAAPQKPGQEALRHRVGSTGELCVAEDLFPWVRLV